MNKYMKNFKQNLKTFFKNLALRVSLQEKVLFARHLAIMARSGLPLLDSLNMLKKQSRSRAMKKILERLSGDINNGQFLADSLEQFKSIFGPLFIDIIRVGEASGILSENLNYLAEELKKKQELRRKVIGAMIYPAVVLVATFGITGLLTVFIFPKILPVFASFNVNLPFSTRLLIKISNLMTHYGGWVTLGLFLMVIAFWLALKMPAIRFFYHRLVLHAPIFGKLVKAVNLSNFCRTLGLTLKSGVQAVQAISITAGTLTNLVYKKELQTMGEDLARGESICKYLGEHEYIFPPMVGQMVSVGENTGNLSETLLYLAEFYEAEVNDFTKNLSNVLEPLLMVIMGVIVGFVAISIITPIYEVTNTLRQ